MTEGLSRCKSGYHQAGSSDVTLKGDHGRFWYVGSGSGSSPLRAMSPRRGPPVKSPGSPAVTNAATNTPSNMARSSPKSPRTPPRHHQQYGVGGPFFTLPPGPLNIVSPPTAVHTIYPTSPVSPFTAPSPTRLGPGGPASTHNSQSQSIASALRGPTAYDLGLTPEHPSRKVRERRARKPPISGPRDTTSPRVRRPSLTTALSPTSPPFTQPERYNYTTTTTSPPSIHSPPSSPRFSSPKPRNPRQPNSNLHSSSLTDLHSQMMDTIAMASGRISPNRSPKAPERSGSPTQAPTSTRGGVMGTGRSSPTNSIPTKSASSTSIPFQGFNPGFSTNFSSQPAPRSRTPPKEGSGITRASSGASTPLNAQGPAPYNLRSLSPPKMLPPHMPPPIPSLIAVATAAINRTPSPSKLVAHAAQAAQAQAAQAQAVQQAAAQAALVANLPPPPPLDYYLEVDRARAQFHERLYTRLPSAPIPHLTAHQLVAGTLPPAVAPMTLNSFLPTPSPTDYLTTVNHEQQISQQRRNSTPNRGRASPSMLSPPRQGALGLVDVHSTNTRGGITTTTTHRHPPFTSPTAGSPPRQASPPTRARQPNPRATIAGAGRHLPDYTRDTPVISEGTTSPSFSLSPSSMHSSPLGAHYYQ